jgi:hypothetical protein
MLKTILKLLLLSLISRSHQVSCFQYLSRLRQVSEHCYAKKMMQSKFCETGYAAIHVRYRDIGSLFDEVIHQLSSSSLDAPSG